MDIDELRQKIREANDAYWKKSTSIVSDTEYDRMIENLRKLSPNDPLLDEIGKEKLGEIKVHHVKQMLSLDKHYNWSEMIAWACKVARSDNELFMCSPKYDGLSLEQQGERIVTRGDGVIGTDITHLSSHICVISRYEYDADGKIIGDKMGLVPILENEDIANPTRMVGELLIPYWRFDRLKAEYPEIFQEYKTPRNLISGFANSKYDSVIAQLGYGVGQSVYIADFVSHRAFEIPITLKDLKNGKDPRPAIMKFVNDKHVDYPVDGIVIRLADDQYASSLGVTQHHPLGSMAFKFTSEQVKAKVTRVTWQIGEERVSPIAEFDPVQLDGVMVKRATLHNPTWVKVNKVGIGSTVVIERRGKVIPSVMDVINEDPNIKVVVPDRCPACGEKLVPDGCYLKCPNDECTGKIATKIVRGLSVLGLKGCGPKLVTKAVKEFYIRDIIDWVNTFGSRDQHVLDLLKQKDFKPNEIKNLTSITSVLHDGSTITNILASVCIPKCNTEFVNKVENECGGIQHLMQICPVDRMYDEIVNKCKADAVRNFMVWIENNYERFMQYMSAFRILSTSNPTGISGTVCFTGTGPKPRKELQILAMNNGYQVTENANQCTILVAADVGGNSTKLQKAKSKGIKVISYEEFLETLRG